MLKYQTKTTITAKIDRRAAMIIINIFFHPPPSLSSPVYPSLSLSLPLSLSLSHQPFYQEVQFSMRQNSNPICSHPIHAHKPLKNNKRTKQSVNDEKGET